MNVSSKRRERKRTEGEGRKRRRTRKSNLKQSGITKYGRIEAERERVREGGGERDDGEREP